MVQADVKWKYSLCNEMFENWALSKIAATAADLGYQGIELAPYTLAPLVTDLSAEDRKRIRQDVEGAGMKVSGLHWILAKTPFQLNAPDRERREAASKYLLDLIDFCADVGGEILVFGSPQQRDPMEGWSAEDAWKWPVEAMRRCGERAAQRGVFFCLEPLIGTKLLTGVDVVAKMVREVDHPGLRMMVDTKSMGSDTRWSVADQLKAVWPLFKHVHVNDPNLLGPGMGDLDFRPIVATLRDLGYDRWLSLEVFKFELGSENIARQSLANLKAALQ